MKPSIALSLLVSLGLLCAACSTPQNSAELVHVDKRDLTNACVSVDFGLMAMSNTCAVPMQVSILWNPYGTPLQPLTYRLGPGQNRRFGPRGAAVVQSEGPLQEGLGPDATDQVQVVQENDAYAIHNSSGKPVIVKWQRQGQPGSPPPGWTFVHQLLVPIETIYGPYPDIIMKAEYEPF